MTGPVTELRIYPALVGDDGIVRPPEGPIPTAQRRPPILPPAPYRGARVTGAGTITDTERSHALAIN